MNASELRWSFDDNEISEGWLRTWKEKLLTVDQMKA